MPVRISISWWVNYNLIKLKRSGRYVASRVKYDINSLKDPFIAQQFSFFYYQEQIPSLPRYAGPPEIQWTKVGIA